MFNIEIDVTALKAVNQRIDTMVEAIATLKHVDLGNELADWETGDLNRKRAYTKHRYNGGSTIIRAHSWYETKGRKRTVRKFVRRRKYHARWSNRPVLRPQLLDLLVDRVAALAEQSLHW
jgi:hypothetical protein